MLPAHYDFKRDSSIHEHFYPKQEVYEVIEGELEVTIDGVAWIAQPGLVAVGPSNVHDSVKAFTDGKAIVVDYPERRDIELRRLAGSIRRKMMLIALSLNRLPQAGMRDMVVVALLAK